MEWAGAMAGEAGEACNAAKKLKRIECSVTTVNEAGRHFDSIKEAQVAVCKEAADTILYAVLLILRAKGDPEEVIREVFNKKSEEYGFPERL